MSISIENISPTSRQVEITLPIEEVTKQYNKKLRELASKVRMDGFRPGKIPVNVIQRKYGTQAFQEVRANIISESFYNYISEQNIPLIHGSASFELDNEANENNKDNLKFFVKFEVYPELKIENVDTLQITKMIVDISDQDIEDAINQITKVHGKTIDLTEEAQDQHIATIQWSLFNKEDEVIPEMENTNSTLEIGNTTDEVLQQINPHIKGLKPQESKKVEITFSDAINNEDISGKTLKLEIQLEKLQKVEVAEINTDFIKELGIQSGSIEDFRSEIKANLVHNAKKISNKRLEEEMMSQLCKLNKIEELPAYLISQESKHIKQSLLQKRPELLKEGIKSLEEAIEARAKELITRSLIVTSLIDKYNVSLNEKDFNEYIQSYVQFMENPKKALEAIYSNKKMMYQIHSDIMRDMCIKAAIKEANVQEKIYSYEKALDYSAANLG